MVGKAQNRMGRNVDCMANVLIGFHRSTFSKPNTDFNSDFWAFPTLKRSSKAKNFEVMNGLHYVFEKWVERCKKCIACQGRYFEKEIVPAPPPSSDSEQ
jgi:hypothetical protein